MTAAEAETPSGARPWHAEEAADVAAGLGVDPAVGLSPREARRRRASGVTSAAGRSRWRSQAGAASRAALRVSALSAFVMAMAADGSLDAVAAGLALLALSAAIVLALSLSARFDRLPPPEIKARVLRGGRLVRLDPWRVVAGDVLDLIEGDLVTSDARLFDAQGVAVDESALDPCRERVLKDATATAVDAPPLERACYVFAGSRVIAGRGRALVTAASDAVAFAEAAHELDEDARGESLEQRRLVRLSRAWEIIAALVGVGVAGIAALRHAAPAEAIGLGAACVFALSAPYVAPWSRVRLNRLIRRLGAAGVRVRRAAAVDALAGVEVVLCDLRGVVTHAEPIAERLTTLDSDWRFTTDGAIGAWRMGERLSDVRADPAAIALGAAAAVLGARSTDTETAAFCALAPRLDGRAPGPVIALSSVDGERRALVDGARGRLVFVWGAYDRVVEQCKGAAGRWDTVLLDGDARRRLDDLAARLRRDGCKTFALARSPVDPQRRITLDAPGGLEFLGIVGLSEGLVSGARDAAAALDASGVVVSVFAEGEGASLLAAARRAGLRAPLAVGADEIDRMTDQRLARLALDGAVFVDGSAEHKARTVRVLRRQQTGVMMLTSRSADARALRVADVGAAWSSQGSEGARREADLVFERSGLAGAAAAIEAGRARGRALRRSLTTPLAFKVALATTVLAGVVFAAPILSPILVLLASVWLDAGGLLLDRASTAEGLRDFTLKSRPDRRRLFALVGGGVASGLLAAAGFAFAYSQIRPDADAYGAAFAWLILVLGGLLLAANAEAGRRPIFSRPSSLQAGFVLTLASLSSAAALSLYVAPFANGVGLAPAPASDWIVAAGLLAPLALAPEFARLLAGSRPKTD